jgi:hypothetical protein
MSSSRSPQVLLRHLANLLAPGLVFLPSFVAFIQFQGYPLWRPEVLSIAGFLLLAGLPFGLLLSLRPRTFGAAAVALLLFAWITQISAEGIVGLLALWDGFSQSLVAWAGLYGGLAISFLVALLIAVIPFAALSWLGPNLGIVLATVFSVTLVSTLLLPAEPLPLGETYRRDAGPAKDLPPVIHLVFDEQIGVEGLPADIAGSEDLRDELRRFYEDFGFTLFGRAYSEYARTNHSMIALLNGFDSLDGKFPEGPDAFWRSFWDNQWFKVLAQRGYLIHAYHMNGWDYCGGEAGHAARCVTYTTGSITNIEGADLTVEAKTKVILASYLHSLIPYRAFRLLAGPDDRPPWVLPERPFLYAPDSLGVLERMLADIRAAPRGTAYFAHLMIPHVTHMLDRDCKVRADPLTWTSYGDLDIPTGVLNSRVSREARYIGYFAQVRCLHSALRRFLEGLQEIGVFDDATIVVHGDHGSRIAHIAPLTTTPRPLSDEDLADMYSVLFAVRSPSLASGYRPDLVSLQALFREMFLGGTHRDRPPEVYLDYPATIDASLTKPPFPRRPMSDLRRAPNSP